MQSALYIVENILNAKELSVLIFPICILIETILQSLSNINVRCCRVIKNNEQSMGSTLPQKPQTALLFLFILVNDMSKDKLG